MHDLADARACACARTPACPPASAFARPRPRTSTHAPAHSCVHPLTRTRKQASHITKQPASQPPTDRPTDRRTDTDAFLYSSIRIDQLLGQNSLHCTIANAVMDRSSHMMQYALRTLAHADHAQKGDASEGRAASPCVVTPAVCVRRWHWRALWVPRGVSAPSRTAGCAPTGTSAPRTRGANPEELGPRAALDGPHVVSASAR